MPIRLGDLLVQRGVLTVAQRDEIVSFQRLHARPFGMLAEEMFGVSPSIVESAWAEQFASLAQRITLDDMTPTREASDLVERRQAWQFALVPIRFEDEELLAATSVEHLARAMRFAGWRIPFTCRMAICSEADLRAALSEHFAIPGMEHALEDVHGAERRTA